jgi:hypothetical protein
LNHSPPASIVVDDMLLERHVLAWTHLWQHFYVDLTDGDTCHRVQMI